MAECEICCCGEMLFDNRNKLSLKGDFYPGFEVRIYKNYINIVADADTYEPGYLECYVPISFCPKCGRKLSAEN